MNLSATVTAAATHQSRVLCLVQVLKISFTLFLLKSILKLFAAIVLAAAGTEFI